MCSTPHTHDVGELWMFRESLFNQIETRPFAAVHYEDKQIYRVEGEVLSNKPAYQELGPVRCILGLPRRVMQFEEGGRAVLI